jgi:salicylate hydroxylase
MHPQVAVVGGGIGALAAALSLFGPNASRVSHGLGLADELAKLGVRPGAHHQRRWDNGRTLLKAPLGDTVIKAFGFPHYQSHRADVMAMLIDALPAERLNIGHRLVAVTDCGDRVEAEFENGERITTDALIGADGIHSTVRELLFGPANPHFTGCVAYRGLIPVERIKHLDVEVNAQRWMGPGKHIVIYYVAAKRLLNFVGIVEQSTWIGASWTDRGDVDALRAAFADWDPNLRAIIETIDETFIWGLFDRAPLPQWSVGRVTLLGDAAHPMLPFMAQGAAQALEDGVSLTTCLSTIGDAAAAFARHEKLRLPRTSRIQAMSAASKTSSHLPDGPAQQERDAKMAAGTTYPSIKAMAWVYNYDAAAAVETGDLGLPAEV